MALQRLDTTLPSTGATSTYDQVVGEIQARGRVSSVSYTPEAAITGANSPASRTFTVVNKGQDGTGTTTIATLALTSGINAAAFDELQFTLSATATNRDVAVGDVLLAVSTAVGGTGLADPGGLIQVEVDTAGITTTVSSSGSVTHTQ